MLFASTMSTLIALDCNFAALLKLYFKLINLWCIKNISWGFGVLGFWGFGLVELIDAKGIEMSQLIWL